MHIGRLAARHWAGLNCYYGAHYFGRDPRFKKYYVECGRVWSSYVVGV